MNKDKGIKIVNAAQRQEFRNMGYFHGYKGYRFAGRGEKRLNYTNFNELQAVYDFDMGLKALLYQQVMFIETALKNRVLEVTLQEAGSGSFDDIYNSVLTRHKEHEKFSKPFRKQISKRLNLRNRIYKELSYSMSRNIVTHYYWADKSVPIWAIFELLALGEFGNFISCMNRPIRVNVSKCLKIDQRYDAEGTLSERLIFTIKDLRNSIAHDNPVFDVRFKSGKTSQQVCRYLSHETDIKGISLTHIDDCIILICFMTKKLGRTKTEMETFVHSFEKLAEALESTVPATVFNEIVTVYTHKKMEALKKYISK